MTLLTVEGTLYENSFRVDMKSVNIRSLLEYLLPVVCLSVVSVVCCQVEVSALG
jgi:hypothetical protein